MRIAIMQPTYLPWLGYFNLIAEADRFVFLDDTQFSRQSWQQRNRIIQNEQLVWLTVPVLTSGRLGQTIREVQVKDELPWRRKHLAAITAANSRAAWEAETSSLVREVLNSPESCLCEINISLIIAVSQYLGLKTQFLRASNLDCQGGRSERLLAICSKLGGALYLSPSGARDYIESDGVFAAANFPVAFQAYSPAPYRNIELLSSGNFPSILDALAWIGPEATRALVFQSIS